MKNQSFGHTVVLTGFMCAGKTTVAAALARRLNCKPLDLDVLVSEREGRDVASLIKEKGEADFRAAETRALNSALAEDAARVIALGGGTWTLERNRALIIEHDCFTVWLDVPFELCWQRIESARDERPLAPDFESARKLYDERRPLYQMASLRVNARGDRDADELADEIIQALNGLQGE